MEHRNLGFDVNPDGTRLFIVQAVFLVLVWIVSLLRAQVKVFIIKKVMVDDWIMLVAVLIYTAYGIIAIYGVIAGGTGKHPSELTPDGIAAALKSWYLCEVLYAPLSAFIRTSIAAFLLRLAAASWQIWVIRVNIGVIWVVSIVFCFLMMFQCSPASYFWEHPSKPNSTGGSCIMPEVVPIATVVHGVASCMADWVLGLLPVVILWRVQLNRRTKISIGFLLSLGVIAGVAMVVRIPLIKNIAITADFLFETVNLAIWSILEPSLSILASCIATLRPLLRSWDISLNWTKWHTSRYPQSAGSMGRRVKMHNTQKLPEAFTDSSKGNTHGVKLDDSGCGIESRKDVSDLHKSKPSQDSEWDIERGYCDGCDCPDGTTVQTSVHITAHRVSSVEEPVNHATWWDSKDSL
ncbi:uncharacterized protein BCR38DRAFT_389901 [Pseudomassariella vexata]|uniref:Rhodopsin domain-containing protein n=1 Tax=Pseudomassariella vexata TaxID=1141098 RepID=A0A1Y2E478_9PEZI|nr:uncharacterized protein BCR38DRAFT_389901 [Pseudomassariella vexata]ORY66332.1 hypothetical protein BCR38DRAFT_389901 [Pseudomassariella vexata]